MTKQWLALFLLPALTLLHGCGWMFGDEGMFRDRSDDYRRARSLEPLQIPREFDEEAIDDSFNIPRIGDETALQGEFVLPQPEPLDENVQQESVTIQKLGEDRWILVESAPGQIWPRIRGFLNNLRLPVARADAVSGIIETGWLQPAVEGALRERYRFRIEQGVQRGTSEVYVLQADLRAGEDGWPRDSSNPEREDLMVRELAQYFADSAAASTVSMLAQQAIEASGKAFLRTDEQGRGFIWLQLPFDRAWASLGSGLEKAGFALKDWDRSKGTYWVEYQPPRDEDEEEEGFFASLLSWGDDDEVAPEPYLVHMRELQGDKPAMGITIEPTEGELGDEDRERLLKRIKNFLS